MLSIIYLLEVGVNQGKIPNYAEKFSKIKDILIVIIGKILIFHQYKIFVNSIKVKKGKNFLVSKFLVHFEQKICLISMKKVVKFMTISILLFVMRK